MTSEALDGVSKLGEFCFLFKTTPSDYNLFFGASFRKWSLMKLQAIPIMEGLLFAGRSNLTVGTCFLEIQSAVPWFWTLDDIPFCVSDIDGMDENHTCMSSGESRLKRRVQ